MQLTIMIFIGHCELTLNLPLQISWQAFFFQICDATLTINN